MTEPLVFLKGEMVPASQAHLNIYDQGIVLGATVTEMIRTFRHQPFRLKEHIDRLFRSMKYMEFDIQLTRENLATRLTELVQHNAGLIEQDDELGLVIFVTPGENLMYAGSAAAGVNMVPTLCAHTFPLPFEFWAEKMQTGSHLVISSTRHVPPQCYHPNMKYRSRMHYYLADLEARKVDPQAAALLLDLNGNVTETSGANFLIVEGGTIVSPTLTNTLPGVSRQVVIELADELGIPFEVRDFQSFQAINADEAMTTTTPYCVMPVTSINKHAIGSGKPGPIVQQLQEAWSKKIGYDLFAQIQNGATRRTAART
ncbi:putative branched-chain-amino-acid aminotransferase [Polystyrenella longa]|uniref:branched-chain-amino-acid transaminase n=1 Tax=Polystyrenella longa TaxID=2528007 RepID=A0A518CNY9_9PLAN|nr:aminotransferase class IV [Polystyrenella longa]QDU80914.1 putative branched-chain-amino-acid aminotransferase [Polystyrenella longa]